MPGIVFTFQWFAATYTTHSFITQANELVEYSLQFFLPLRKWNEFILALFDVGFGCFLVDLLCVFNDAIRV